MIRQRLAVPDSYHNDGSHTQKMSSNDGDCSLSDDSLSDEPHTRPRKLKRTRSAVVPPRRAGVPRPRPRSARPRTSTNTAQHPPPSPVAEPTRNARTWVTVVIGGKPHPALAAKFTCEADGEFDWASDPYRGQPRFLGPAPILGEAHYRSLRVYVKVWVGSRDGKVAKDPAAKVSILPVYR